MNRTYDEENNHYNHTIIIATDENSTDCPAYLDDIWKDLSINILSQFHSRMVNMQINVTVLNSGESDIIPIYLTRGHITGQ